MAEGPTPSPDVISAPRPTEAKAPSGPDNAMGAMPNLDAKLGINTQPFGPDTAPTGPQPETSDAQRQELQSGGTRLESQSPIATQLEQQQSRVNPEQILRKLDSGETTDTVGQPDTTLSQPQAEGDDKYDARVDAQKARLDQARQEAQTNPALSQEQAADGNILAQTAQREQQAQTVQVETTSPQPTVEQQTANPQTAETQPNTQDNASSQTEAAEQKPPALNTEELRDYAKNLAEKAAKDGNTADAQRYVHIMADIGAQAQVENNPNAPLAQNDRKDGEPLADFFDRKAQEADAAGASANNAEKQFQQELSASYKNTRDFITEAQSNPTAARNEKQKDATPIPGLEGAKQSTSPTENTPLSNEQLVAQETNLEQQLAQGKIDQEQYHNEQAKLAEQTDMGVSRTEADSPEGYTKNTVENATIHEPTAEERANGTQVTENAEGGERSQNQAARLEGIKIATELNDMGIDLKSETGQKLAEAIAENPALMETVKLTAEAMKQYQEAFGTEATQQSAEATKNSLEEQAQKAEAKGDKKESSRIKNLLKILLAITAALLLAPGAVAAIGVNEMSKQTK